MCHTASQLNSIWKLLFYRNLQKQPPRGVLTKRCSENMQQVYRRTPLPKCDFIEITHFYWFLIFYWFFFPRFYWNHTSAWVFSFKFSAYFQNAISKEHLWVAASESLSKIVKIILWSTSLALHSVFDIVLICFFEKLQHFFDKVWSWHVYLDRGKKEPWY